MNVPAINKDTLTRSEFETRLIALFPLAVVKQFPISTWVYGLEGDVLGGLVCAEKRVGRGLAMLRPVGYLHN